MEEDKQPFDARFMTEAIKLSLEKMEKNEGGPFGAVVVKNGKIVSRGWNQVTSTNDPTAHAEMVAIRKACKKLETFWLGDCSIYVNCEPCPMCLAAIYWAGIPKLFCAATAQDASAVGFGDRYIYDELLKPTADRNLSMIQEMRKEALPAFKKWAKKKDKIEY